MPYTRRSLISGSFPLIPAACLLLAGCFAEVADNGLAPAVQPAPAPALAMAEGDRDSSVKGVTVKPQRAERDAAEAFRLVNEERARRGMQMLQRRPELDDAAYGHARDLMRMNRLSHTSSDGRQLEHRLARLDWEWAGENLARNKGYNSPAVEAVKGWIASPKHYENMFRPDYSQSGMAALLDPDSGFTYFVQIFIIPAT